MNAGSAAEVLKWATSPVRGLACERFPSGSAQFEAAALIEDYDLFLRSQAEESTCSLVGLRAHLECKTGILQVLSRVDPSEAYEILSDIRYMYERTCDLLPAEQSIERPAAEFTGPSEGD